MVSVGCVIWDLQEKTVDFPAAPVYWDKEESLRRHSIMFFCRSLIWNPPLWSSRLYVEQHKCRIFTLFRSHWYWQPYLRIVLYYAFGKLICLQGFHKSRYKLFQNKNNKVKEPVTLKSQLNHPTTWTQPHRGCWTPAQPFTKLTSIFHGTTLLFLYVHFPSLKKNTYLYVNWLFIVVLACVWACVALYGSENSFIFSNWFISPFFQ